MSTYSQEKMMNLINDFELFYIKKKGNLWINEISIKKKIIINPRLYHLVNDCKGDGDFILIKGKKYIDGEKLFEITKKLNTHPEHYNVHNRLGISIKFRKTDEIETIATIYNNYRGKYTMYYQYPELNYRMDLVIVINPSQNGGLTIEIDEDNHANYEEASHEHRQKNLESRGYKFIRIKPGQYTEKQIVKMIDRNIS